MKKTLAIAIALCLTLALSSLPSLSEGEPIKLTHWIDLGATGAAVLSTMDENLVMRKLQEITGVDLEFLHPAVGQINEQFNLLVASRELPDVMEKDWNNYPGGIQKAVDDDVIVELNDIIGQYAPNYSAFFSEQPDLAKQIATDDGMIGLFAAYSI
ncbi:MAG: hypothetical protein LBS11_07140 [Oscillospiraceae bacterium]|jgi:putative aldouronate transport system substrate-binding protein|nr:hypothetical protein [Oscillospiraceae bacterium]